MKLLFAKLERVEATNEDSEHNKSSFSVFSFKERNGIHIGRNELKHKSQNHLVGKEQGGLIERNRVHPPLLSLHCFQLNMESDS
jgi:hypothetical protein